MVQQITGHEAAEIVHVHTVRGLSTNKLGEMFGHHPMTILRVLQRAGVSYAPVQCLPSSIPTPEEIEERAQEVRDTWDENTERSRSVYKHSPVEVPKTHPLSDGRKRAPASD